MPIIRVFDFNESDGNNYRNIEYDFCDELLRDIINKFDQNFNEHSSNVVVGDYKFNNLDVAIDSCLFYGDSIKIL